MSSQISNTPNHQLLPKHYSGKYKGSFAYLTIKDRLPVILVKVVDFLCQNRNSIVEEYGELAKEEIKEVIGKLSALQNEMVTNKLIKPLTSNNPDVILWNEYLEKQEDEFGFPPAWFESSWLYVECYLYRRIKEAFQLSSMFKEFDPFHKQKKESFLSTMDAAVYLVSVLNQTLSELRNSNNKVKLFDLFQRYLEISLWSNKWDLSISAEKLNFDQANPLSQLDDLRKNILVNDSETLWQVLQNAKQDSEEVKIDYVLDNAGFELFCDLCFMHFLLEANLVKEIKLHVKVMPWFVSDTLEQDIFWLLETLSQSNYEHLVSFSKECSFKLSSGQLTIVKEKFWTLPHDFSQMEMVDPLLYNNMSKSNLIIFKGDLNYRKLTGDRQWEDTTLFTDALNGFLPTSLVSLRTVKADVVVGLKPDTSEMMNKLSENWKFTGNFAVIQCAQLCSNS